MLDHVLACMPEEACGIVVGCQGKVTSIRPIENVAHSPTRFRMEPRAQVEALLDLEARRLELLAVFHSHPSGPPGPSAADVAEWSYPEAAAMIWCCENGRWRVRAFDMGSPTLVETEIEVMPEPSKGEPEGT
jgi:[CysO sulfur-carrier protein]-S-L-cysteine hydrolase